MNRIAYGMVIAVLLLGGGMVHSQTQADADLLIVGAGPSGLSAALDAAQQGARVTVIDMWSIFWRSWGPFRRRA